MEEHSKSWYIHPAQKLKYRTYNSCRFREKQLQTQMKMGSAAAMDISPGFDQYHFIIIYVKMKLKQQKIH